MSKNRLFTLVFLAAAILGVYIPQISASAVFKTVDEQGNVTFTDKPPVNSDPKEIEIRPTNTQAPSIPPPPPKAATPDKGKASGDEKEEVKEVPYSSTFITQPLDQSSVPPGQTEVSVQIGLKPPLQAGHVVKLLHNGQPVGTPTARTRFTLTSLIRGEHQVRAQILDANGKHKADTQTVTFYVKRYHPKKNKN